MTETNREQFKTARRYDNLAFLFGRRLGLETLPYLAADAAVMMTNDVLAKSYDRKTAAQMCRVHGDLLGRAIALVDARPEDPSLFVVIDFVTPQGEQAHLCASAQTTDLSAIAAEVEMTPQALGLGADRINAVNLSRIMRFIRENAKRHGLDYSEPFLPPPDSPEFEKIFAPYLKELDRAYRLQNATKREAVVSKISQAAVERVAAFEGAAA